MHVEFFGSPSKNGLRVSSPQAAAGERAPADQYISGACERGRERGTERYVEIGMEIDNMGDMQREREREREESEGERGER